MTPQQKVREFHEAYGMPVSNTPKLLNQFRRALRRVLIEEESEEVFEALDGYDIAHVAKELADLLYVTYGVAVEMGINLDEVFNEVHKSNMSKLGSDGKPIYREDGKVLKGPNYRQADIESILERY